jgi:hypothetical protein
MSLSVIATLTAINQFFPVREAAKQLITKPTSLRKEIAGSGVVYSVVSIYNTIQVSCATSCDFLLVSGDQWGMLVASVIALYAHLRAKALDVRVE